MSGRVFGRELRTALAHREPLLVVNIDYSNSTLVEFLCRNGADVIFIDCEQGDTDFETIPDLVRAAHVAGVPAILRSYSSDSAIMERYLFRGIDGIVVPRLDTAEAARAAVDTMRYCFPDRYEDKALIVQIESLRAAEQIDAFLAVDGIDALFVGPVDLAKSMGHGGQYEVPAVAEVVDRTLQAIVGAGKAAGMLAKPETLQDLRQEGVSFFYVHTNDFIRLGAACIRRALS